MASILICDRPGDAHARACEWGLTTLGHKAAVWDASRFPARQSLSIWLDREGARHGIGDAGAFDRLGEVDTVWNRRTRRPTLSADIDPADVDFAATQSAAHLEGFLSTAWPDAFWVNPPTATRQELNKPLQLRRAVGAGLAIPATLISNAPDEIRSFCAAHAEVIFKPYAGGVWLTEGDRGNPRINFTTLISPSDLERNDTLSFCPGVFQARVPKRFEVRVTVMGRSQFAVRIDSGQEGGASVDWRQAGRHLSLSRMALPTAVSAAIDVVMSAAGLVFACFDFIVTPDGEYHFLEYNQAGQFLWQEEHIPDLPLLDAMCLFLASRDARFDYVESPAALRLGQAPRLGRERAG